MRRQDDGGAVADQICFEAVGDDAVSGDGLQDLAAVGVAEEDGGLDLCGCRGGEEFGAEVDDLCTLAGGCV